MRVGMMTGSPCQHGVGSDADGECGSLHKGRVKGDADPANGEERRGKSQ
jgi:hypothetical protein